MPEGLPKGVIRVEEIGTGVRRYIYPDDASTSISVTNEPHGPMDFGCGRVDPVKTKESEKAK